MPEGLEVHALAYAIQKIGIPCQSYGKHLYINGRDLSFGLMGKVKLNNGIIEKTGNHWMTGYNVACPTAEDLVLTNRLGMNYATATIDDLETIIHKWGKSKRKLAVLLLDQSHIAGIGVAWGSEICHKSGLNPNLPANKQCLDNLAATMIEIRDTTWNIYKDYIDKCQSLEDFVNEWFDNLYGIRQMVVYKKGTKLEIASRNWWMGAIN